jgi:hypothetical protein
MTVAAGFWGLVAHMFLFYLWLFGEAGGNKRKGTGIKGKTLGGI